MSAGSQEEVPDTYEGYVPPDQGEDTPVVIPPQPDDDVNPITGQPRGTEKVQIVVLASGVSQDDVNATLDSVRAQSYSTFDCTVCDIDNRPIATPDSRISVVESYVPFLPGLRIAAAVVAGLVLPPDALQQYTDSGDTSGFVFQPPPNESHLGDGSPIPPDTTDPGTG